MKKKFIRILLIIFLLVVIFCLIAKQRGSKETIESPETFSYEDLGIKEYKYPDEFFMDDSLKRIIASLAFWYGDYDRETAKTDEWKESFIARFIQNSMFSFDYLDEIDQKNDGKITAEEINYIQYSMTNTEVDYSVMIDEYVDCRDNASFLNHAFMDEYTYESNEDYVTIKAIIEVEYQGSADTTQYDITAELIKNPYSCFDGYSIASVRSTEIE